MKKVTSTKWNYWVLSFLSSVGLIVHPLSPPRLHTSPRTGGFQTRQFIPSNRIPSSPLFPLFPVFLLLLLLFPGCKPCDDPTDPECPNYCVDETNPECPNYDPCWDQTEVSAAFHMYEVAQAKMPETWEYYDTDTLCGWGIRFTALEEDATYEWYLGAEIIRERSFVRSGFPRDEPIQVTLIVQKEPNTACFPDDDGRDTLTRTLVKYGSPFNCTGSGPLKFSPIVGTFEGVYAHVPNTQQTITIDDCAEYLIPFRFPDRTVYDTLETLSLFGLLPEPECVRRALNGGNKMFFGYRQWAFHSDNLYYEEEVACGLTIDILIRQPEGTDSIYLDYLDWDEGEKAYSFRGVRKQ